MRLLVETFVKHRFVGPSAQTRETRGSQRPPWVLTLLLSPQPQAEITPQQITCRTRGSRSPSPVA